MHRRAEKKMNRVCLVIIDGLGVGAQEDASSYGDENADTLGHVSEITGVSLPNLQRLGLGNIGSFPSIPPHQTPLAAYGKMRELSAGKDSTTGHWEFAGIQLEQPFPVYPEGFPDQVINHFCEKAGISDVLCNKPYSGTEVIADYGDEHLRTGYPIVYTSADSVFQIACHVDKIPLKKLYDWCKIARDEVMTGHHAVGRVIARPFHGESGSFERLSDQRKDFSLEVPEPNLLSLLKENNVSVYSIGKISDLFAGHEFTQYRKTKSNAEGLSQTLSLMEAGIQHSFTFVNLIDTDQLYGHRQDPVGYAEALQEIDRAIPALISKLNGNDILILSGDHGNDPADDSTDHTREFVPLLAIKGDSKGGNDLGIRDSFSDVSATVLDYFGIDNILFGRSFLDRL